VTISICTPTGRTKLQLPVRYRLEDSLTVTVPKTPVSVWVPLIPETPYQRLIEISIECRGDYTVAREGEFGNSMLHTILTPADGTSQVLKISYGVERLPVMHLLDPSCARPLLSPRAFARHLAAETHVDVDDKTRSLALEIIGAERNPVIQARHLYDYVTGHMAYDATQQSWKGSTQHALTCSVGNCNDIHALFISLARSAGIPARLIIGQALEPPPPGEPACELCGYHCWAEFSCSGLGWVPVDASCACKYGKHALFGDLEVNHIAWSVGRDLHLVPPQRGGSILFFAGPHAESDGKVYGAFSRHITFEQML
jgi:transglutaminase-like putative cysteine protease